jgi:hypothetical protein
MTTLDATAKPGAQGIEYEEETPVAEGSENNQSLILELIKQLKIGMDLTKIPIPAAFLEPRSLLEMYADLNSFPQLFSECSVPTTPCERMVAVLRWYFSAVSCKTGVKKPYNPILGERFDCEWNLGEGGTTSFQAEQVTHHPPRSAYFIQNKTSGVYYAGDNCTRSGFFGTSVGVKNDGFSVMYLPAHNETYHMTFPDGFARGIIVGPMRFELGGDVAVTCAESGYKANITFVVKGWLSGDWDCVTGTITYTDPKTQKSEVLYSIGGKWNGTVNLKDNKTKKTTDLHVVGALRKVKKITTDVSTQQLHESKVVWSKVTEALKRANTEEANNAKIEIEEGQRSERKTRETSGAEWKTRHFHYDENAKLWLSDDFTLLKQASAEKSS